MDSNMIPSLQNMPPLMVNAWAQTTSNVLHLNATDQTDHLKREQESEEEVKELRKQIRDHLEREEELEKEVTELSKQIRDHLKREQESEEEVKELRKQIRDHSEREEELEKEVTELSKQKRDHLKREEELEKEVTELSKQKRDHLKREAELEKEVTVLSKQTRDHLKREEELEKEVTELSKQTRDHLKREEELEKEVTVLSKQTRDHLKREQELEKEVTELSKQTRDHLKREEELEKEVTVLSKQTRDHLKREEELEKEVTELSKQKIDHLKREQELEKEVTELSKQTRDHLKREEESVKEVTELRKQIRDHLKREKQLLIKLSKRKIEHLKREKELDKEVTELRKAKRELLELVSQLHAKTMLEEKQQPQHHLKYEAETLNPSQYPGIICNKTLQIYPNLANNPTSYTTLPNSVINPRQLISSANYESVNYTIVADGNADHNGEPIEIQLAEEDGALNLNNSADSGRLEICLEPEEHLEVKPEHPISPPSEHHIIKRRKLALAQHEVLPSTSGNYNHQQHHKQQYHQQWCEQEEKHQKQSQKDQKRRPRNGLLKSSKIEKTNGSSSTSPNNGINSQCEAASTSHRYYVAEMVSLGPNGTRIPASLYETMSWDTVSIATRTLLMNLFDRHTLATHSMTGKESPAFKGLNKPVKNKLDPDIVADIVYAVSIRCNVPEREVRHAITSKCADENKKLKKGQIREPSTEDKENNKNIVN